MGKNYRFFLSVFWILLGAVLCACYGFGLIEEYWSSMGFALIVVGILQVIRHIRYRTNETYRETVNTAVQDERNKYLATKAWSWAGYLYVLIAAVATIVLKIAELEQYIPITAGSLCTILVLYWVSYLFLRKKY